MTWKVPLLSLLTSQLPMLNTYINTHSGWANPVERWPFLMRPTWMIWWYKQKHFTKQYTHRGFSGSWEAARTDAGSRAVSWGARRHWGKAKLSWSVKRLQLQFLELAAGRESFLFYDPPGNWAFLRWEFRLAGERRKLNLCIAWKMSESLAAFKEITLFAHFRLTYRLANKITSNE